MQETATAPTPEISEAPAPTPAPDPTTINSLSEWRTARESFVSEPAAPQAEAATDAAARDARGRFAPKSEPASESAPEAAPVEAAQEPEKAPAPKPRDNPQARIDQAIARQREAERRLQEAERRAAELEAQVRGPQAQPEAQETPSAEWQRIKALPGAPKQGDFEDYSDYIAAMSTFVADTRYEERAKVERGRAEQARAEQERTELHQTFKGAIDAAVTKDPGFLDALSDDVRNLPTFASLQPGERPSSLHFAGEELLRSDNPEGLMRHLSAHPEDFQRLATLPPREITRFLARLETRLDAASSQTGPVSQVPPTSQAKPPIRPVGSSANAPATRDAKDINSLAEWRAQKARLASGR